jgi:hypothetical protein
MKRVIRTGGIALVLALTTAAIAIASGGPSGTYKTTITSPSYLKGTYRITFTPGHWVVHGPITSSGTDKVSGSRITIRGTGPCSSSGTYKFKLTSRTVKFTKISDPCVRSSLITAHTWTKV